MTNIAHAALPVDFETLQSAAEWFAVLRSDAATPLELRQWQEWLAAREEHRAAWQRVEAINARYSLLAASPSTRSTATAVLHTPHSLSRRSALKTLLALAAGSAALGLAARHAPLVGRQWATLGAGLKTATGETREIALTTSARLWLNTASAADFDERARLVTLHDGEILLDMTRDAQPLIVETAQGRLRAENARVAVQQLPDRTLTSVFSGRVEIRTAANRYHSLPAGQQMEFGADEFGAAQRAEPSHQAWSHGVLLADDLTLGRFIGELARYFRGHLHCDPAIAPLRVVGAYPLREPDRILTMLEAALPIHIHRVLPWWVTLEARIA